MTKKTSEERCRTILANLFREDGRELSEDIVQQIWKDLWFVANGKVDPGEDVPADSLAKQTLISLSRIVKVNCEDAAGHREGAAAALLARQAAKNRKWDAPKANPKAPKRVRKTAKKTPAEK